MALDAYMTIKGNKQGDISQGASSVQSAGLGAKHEKHENEITVIGFSSSIFKPRDPKSGAPSGARVHEPVVFTKVFDKSSPKLWQALAAGEQLEIEIKFFRADTSGLGEPEEFFQIKFEKALLCGGKGNLPLTVNAQNDHLRPMDEWSFTYEKVTWTHKVGGNVEGTDTWQAA